MIFDTDVLVWYFRGNQNARELISTVPYRDGKCTRHSEQYRDTSESKR
jgi:hypothetical protein